MYDESERPNPDELLRQIGTEEAPDRTGKLKIFFGYSAGVGKTYAMLRAAHDCLDSGIDVVVGYIEPHTRAERMKLVVGLPVLPTRQVSYKNIVLNEFDLTARSRAIRSSFLWTSLPIRTRRAYATRNAIRTWRSF